MNYYFTFWRRRRRGEPGAGMVALFFEVYGAFCVFALVVFLVWAAVAKLRPDLDEEELDLAELEKLEKLKKLVSSEESCGALSIESPIIEKPSSLPPARPVKQGKRSIRTRPHLFHTRKPRTTWS
jgi:hypothetical protein